ncbi:PIN domain-like protein, partial [Cerioporus squamosus]
SIWIHTMLHALSSSYPQSGENCQLRHMFSRLAMLAERPIHAVFVADGRQRPTYKRGKQVKPAEVWLTDGLRRMVEAFGFGWLEVSVCRWKYRPYSFPPVFQAAGEAEAELSRMASLGLIDAVMTDDSDTLVFGATVVIRKYVRTGSDKVSVYRRTNILDKTGLSTDDLFLFALLVGCDYDQEGLRNCGPKVAEGLARYGLGRTLRRALDTYNDEQLAQYLVVWRDQVRSRLRDDPHGYIGRKHPQLAANIPPMFPKLEAARLLASPVLLANTSYDAVLRPRPIDFGQLGAACERHFGWGSAAEIRKTFRTALWPCELIRMLLSEGLSREGIASKVSQHISHPYHHSLLYCAGWSCAFASRRII